MKKSFDSMTVIAVFAIVFCIGLVFGVKLGERRGYDRAVKSAVIVESDDVGASIEYEDGDIHYYKF